MPDPNPFLQFDESARKTYPSGDKRINGRLSQIYHLIANNSLTQRALDFRSSYCLGNQRLFVEPKQNADL
jgi:hypothetical protein